MQLCHHWFIPCNWSSFMLRGRKRRLKTRENIRSHHYRLCNRQSWSWTVQCAKSFTCFKNWHICRPSWTRFLRKWNRFCHHHLRKGRILNLRNRVQSDRSKYNWEYAAISWNKKWGSKRREFRSAVSARTELVEWYISNSPAADSRSAGLQPDRRKLFIYLHWKFRLFRRPDNANCDSHT